MVNRVILFFVWFILWGLLNWPADWQHLVIGVFVSVFIVFITGELFVGRIQIFTRFRRYLWFLYYIFVFIWECIKANIDVAYRVIHPNLPIHPGIVKVRTNLTSDIALTFLANSITLTPGTLTVDIDKEKGVLYIHWIDVKDKDVHKATGLIVEKFERILKKVFEG